MTAKGHTGALCEDCDIQGTVWGKSYARNGDFQCIECD